MKLRPDAFEIQEDHAFDIKALAQKYFRFWPLFIGTLAMTFIIAFTINQFTPPAYRIESKFLIKDEGNAMNLFDMGAMSANGILPKGQKMANETIMLKSRSVAADVLDQLPFDVEYYRPGLFVDSQLYPNTPLKAQVDWKHEQLAGGRIMIRWTNHTHYSMELLDREYEQFLPGEETPTIIERPRLPGNQFAFGEWVDLPYLKFRLQVTALEQTGTAIIKFRTRESLLQQYTGEKLQIVPADKISSILLFSLETHQPQKARDYLNTLMSVFLENELDEKNGLARNTVNFIDSQLSGISDSLNYTENKLEKFRSSHRTYNITTEGSTIFEKLSELEKVLAEENFKKEYYQNLQNYLANENYKEIVVPSGLGIDDPVLNKLIGDLIGLQSDKSRFLATQTESSPTVQEVSRKIADLNSSIKEVLNNVTQNTILLITDLEKRIAKIESQFGKLPQTEQDLLNIKRKYSLNENIYTFLLQRRAEAAISLASNTPANKIIEAAVLNLMPLRLKPLLNYVMALLVGFTLPMVVIFIIDFFSIKLQDLKELEQKLKIPLVGNIGQNKHSSPLVVFNQPRSSLTEAFRALRTNINFTFPKDKQVTIMITSTISGEGKTFCALNLASVYAVSGRRTILVGCDMHKRFRFDDLNIKNTHGLSDYLSGQSKAVAEIIQQSEFENLDVLTPGPIPPNPAELLINDRFEQLVGQLKNMYDVIILDSSPLGLTNETLYLTRIADLTLFILRQNYSERSFIEEINQLKEKRQIKHIYAVINDVEEKYLRHRGYGYGYYAEDTKKGNVVEGFIKKAKMALQINGHNAKVAEDNAHGSHTKI